MDNLKYEVRNGGHVVMARFKTLEEAMERAANYHNRTKDVSGTNSIRYTVHGEGIKTALDVYVWLSSYDRELPIQAFQFETQTEVVRTKSSTVGAMVDAVKALAFPNTWDRLDSEFFQGSLPFKNWNIKWG